MVKKIVIVCFAIGIVWIVAMALRPSLRRPFVLDEAEESQIGWKMITMGSRTFAPAPAGGNMPLSHPLLYTLTQSLLQRAFGHRELPLRLYGVFHFLLSLGLVLLIVRQLIDTEERLKRWGMFLAAALYLLNPLLLQHSVVINADNNILTTAILLCMYFFVRFEKLQGKAFFQSRLQLMWMLALCYWCKEMAPIFLTAGVLAYRLLRRQKDAFKLDLLLFGLGGVAVFWLTWWLYCRMTGIDVWGFIKYTMVGKSQSAFSYRYLKGIWGVFSWGSRWHIYWVSAPFFAALGAFFLQRLRVFLRKEPLEPIDAVFLVAAAIWVPFQFFRPNVDMMKYQYPCYPLFIIVIAWNAVRQIRQNASAAAASIFCLRNLLIFAGLCAVLTFHYYMLGDYLLPLWDSLTKHLHGHFNLYYYLPVVAVCAIAMTASRRGLRWANGIIACTLCILPIHAGLCLNQAKANYDTAEIYLNYGESGLAETIAYLGGRVKPGSTIAVREDLEYHLTKRCGIAIAGNILPYTLFHVSDRNVMQMIFSRAPIDYLVLDRISTGRMLNNDPFILLGQYFLLERKIGDFYVFRRKPS
ncbi:MAG TPA: glycosyltransferase family 39 protein [Patescibacteria group bacterium]|nr:glycosyltransferase family 39 protein [Patescibacteria group bacterium]